MTNGDKWRAKMAATTDVEIAMLKMRNKDCPPCDGDPYCESEPNLTCYKCWFKWLGQEADND